MSRFLRKVKPCPFCGYKKVLLESAEDHFVWCPQCNATGPLGETNVESTNRRTAREKWNNREWQAQKGK